MPIAQFGRTLSNPMPRDWIIAQGGQALAPGRCRSCGWLQPIRGSFTGLPPGDSVPAWLRGLGLEQYVQLFRDNDIDGEILCGMTAEDLKELGISSFGHRRRLLNAITALGGEPPTRDVAQSATSATSAPTPPPPIDAERRQLTMVFCDLVGSTELSARLDPEDLREIIAAYHRAVADVVGNLDGFVAKYMGDGVLVYFGYPRAHEDDAERAVRAGLGMIDAVGRLHVKSAKRRQRQSSRPPRRIDHNLLLRLGVRK
jgi:hypothetical protein